MAKEDVKRHSAASETTLNTVNTFDNSSILTAEADQEHGIEDEELPPPAYSEHYGTIEDGEGAQGTKASVTDNGRVDIRINQQTKGLSSLLVPALRSQLDLLDLKGPAPPPYVPTTFTGVPGGKHPPPLNVVIHVVGSRGDVQPFVALGKVLKEQHNHRVRLATHPVFKEFVEENGLEFFNIAGDPAELMAFMVKNPGLMPGFDTLRSGDIGRRRREIGIMVRRCWRSCIETGDGSGIEASDKSIEPWVKLDDGAEGDPVARPFVADAIIANPPSFAHIHCAEKLGIPLHMMFTMPWSPTQSFPHPLANIQSSNADANMTNFISYALVDMMTWQGLGDVINRFRQKSLALEPVSATWAPGMLARLRIPWTYCWSPALIPKPRDWGSHISVSGFYFLNLATNYTPVPELQAFLDAGPPPVYIGFGSIVVDDPDAMTQMIFKAIQKSGKRALVSKGWGGMGADHIGIPDGVYMLGNVPHDWLFKHVSAVVHHGGAGTTAAGIAAGKPTFIVPFFGDQPFWGAMVARAGAGPKPVPYKDLTSDILAESIQQALQPETVQKAKEMSEGIRTEKGTEEGARFFHEQLDMDMLRCTLCPTRAAVWRIKRTQVRLSAFAATVLGNASLLKFSDLKLYRQQEHYCEDEPFDPVSGATAALLGTMGSMAMGIADMPVAALKALNIHPDSKLSKSRSKDGDVILGTPVSDMSGQYQSSGLLSPTSSQSTPMGSSHGIDQLGAANDIANRMAQPGPPSPGRSASPSTPVPGGQTQPSPSFKFTANDALGTGTGVFKIASAGIRSPLDFTLGLARGFHNAPKLYGDDTVRQSDKIDGFSSGLKAAGKEFGYGFYDGISGLVTHPIEGVKKEGAVGLLKGFGKGIGGVVLKPGAAIWGLPGYTSQGIYKELQKMFGPSVDNYIMASRTAQGYEDVAKSTQEEREAIIRRWKEVKPYIRKKKTLGEEGKETLGKRTEILSKIISRGKSPNPPVYEAAGNEPIPGDLSRTDSVETEGVWSPAGTRSRAATTESSILKHQNLPTEDDAEDADFEEAVRRSVAETSKGNPEEDVMIERAIRASVAELEASRSRGANDEEIQHAMEQSIREATRGFRQPGEGGLEVGLEDEQLQQAFRASESSHAAFEDADRKADREEEIIMQYMMRQSLAEEEMRKKRDGTS